MKIKFNSLVSKILTEMGLPSKIPIDTEHRQIYSFAVDKRIPASWFDAEIDNPKSKDLWLWDVASKVQNMTVEITTNNFEQALECFAVTLLVKCSGRVVTNENVREFCDVVRQRLGHIDGEWRVINQIEDVGTVKICVHVDPLSAHKNKLKTQFKDDSIFNDAVDLF